MLTLWNLWEQCHFGTMSQDSREDKPYLGSGYMIVDKSHTHAHGIQETHMNVVGKLRSVYTLLLGKHCWRALIQMVYMISYCGLWHSKRNIPRKHSLSCCVFVPGIFPNWLLFFNFILKCNIFDCSLFYNPILTKTRRQDSDWREMNKSALFKAASYYKTIIKMSG